MGVVEHRCWSGFAVEVFEHSGVTIYKECLLIIVGFAFGQKNVKASTQYVTGNPAGLLARAKEEDEEGVGIIYVTLNYRVSNPVLIYGTMLNNKRAALSGFYQAQISK